MKYTKTAAALALAGMAVAPLAQAEPVVTLSGSIGINLGSDDSDDTDGRWAFSGDDSTLNIAATDTLANGLTGYGNYRLDSALSGSTTGGDAITIGIKGDFGDLAIGEVGNAIEYGQMAGDILADVGTTQDAAIGYTGTFGGVTVGLNWSPSQNQSTIGAGVKFSAGGFSIGAGAGSQGTSDDPAFSVGTSFSFAGASVAVAYKDFETSSNTPGSEATIDTRLDAAGVPELFVVPAEDAVNAVGSTEAASVKVGYSIGDVGLGLTFETLLGDGDGDKVRLDASYGLGGGWGTSARVNITDDVTDYRVQFSKSF